MLVDQEDIQCEALKRKAGDALEEKAQVCEGDQEENQREALKMRAEDALERLCYVTPMGMR